MHQKGKKLKIVSIRMKRKSVVVISQSQFIYMILFIQDVVECMTIKRMCVSCGKILKTMRSELEKKFRVEIIIESCLNEQE